MPPLQAIPTPSYDLIRLDKKSILFILILALLYVGMSTAKLHTSSITYWDKEFNQPKPKSLIAGNPKGIRADEWRVATPLLIGQYFAGMPVHNPSVGSGNAPVIWGFPVKDISSLLRPAVWSYFIFDIERAFAFSWNFYLFFFLVSTFLLFLMLTGSQFWISAFGVVFLFLSSGIQWWSYYVAIYMLYMNGGLIALLCLLYSRRPVILVLSGLVLLFSAYGYLFNLYPPFQIPLVYLYLFVFIGFVWWKGDFPRMRENAKLKIGILSAVLLLFAFFTYHYYHLTKESFGLMLQTVYPGNRFSSGGNLAEGKLFAEFFLPFMQPERVPQNWQNICEASGFLVFLPIVLYTMGVWYYRYAVIDRLLVTLSIFLLLCTAFVLFGFPDLICRMTMLSMVESRRLLVIAEAGNCILFVVFLARAQSGPELRIPWKELLLLTPAVILFFVLVGRHVNASTDNFFTQKQLTNVVAIFSVAYLLTRCAQNRYALTLLCILLLSFNMTYASVNPLTRGLSSILENPLVKATRAIHAKDPKAGWLVFGSTIWANLIKSSGLNVLNGTKLIPDNVSMEMLDSARQNDSIYNRYAHIGMKSYVGPNDSVYFEYLSTDWYRIYMDPCSPSLKKLGIKYIVFSYDPQPEDLRCLTSLDAVHFYIYKRKDE